MKETLILTKNRYRKKLDQISKLKIENEIRCSLVENEK